jgi:hypothetical protein
MMKTQTISLAAALTAVLAAAPAAADGVEISVFGSQISGGYGSDQDSDRQMTNARFLYGDRTQVSVDIGFVRARNPQLGVVESPFGPIAVGPKRKGGDQGSGGSGGNGGGGGTGGGSGSGGGVTGGFGASSGTLVSAADATDPLGVDEWVSGPGDVRLGLSHRLVGGGARVYRVDADLRLKAPVADEDDYLGTGEWDYRIGVSGQYRYWSVTGFAGIGWNALGDPAWVELDDVLDVFVGVESEPVAEKMIFSGWLESNEEVIAGTGSRSAAGFGVRTIGKIRLQAQLTAGLGGSAEDFSALLGVNFGVDRPTIGKRRIR